MDEDRFYFMTEQAPPALDLSDARRQFSRAGWAVAAILAVGSAAQILCALLIRSLAPELADRGWVFWVNAFAPIYLFGFPCGFLILRRSRRFEGVGEPMNAGLFLRALVVCFPIMYAGNYIGSFINLFLQFITDLPAGNPVESLAASESGFFKILILVVLGPLMEELLFRKLLIDRLRGYGERLAVLASALLFGLFHGNFAQFFYAFGLGLVFGYLYLRSRQLRWSLLLHMFINFIGGVVAPAMVTSSVTDAASLLDFSPAALAYLLCYLGLVITGTVVFIRKYKALRFEPAPEELPRGKRFSTAFLNVGMLLFLLVSLSLFIFNAMYV